LEKAAKIIQGASYARTDVTLADKIAVHKEKDRQLSMLNIQLLGAKTPEQKRQIQNDIMERERQIENDLTRQSGGSGQSISSTLPSAGQQTGASMSSKGYKLLGTE
jgi:TolA-binding protein